MIGGLGLMSVGIPLWAIGKSKERHIRIDAELVKFKGLASANGIGVKIDFRSSFKDTICLKRYWGLFSNALKYWACGFL